MACPWCGRDDAGAGDRATGYHADDYCSAACEEAALDRDADGADAADAATDDAARACWAARVALLDLQQFVRAARTAQQALVLYQTIREIEQDVAQLVQEVTR